MFFRDGLSGKHDDYMMSCRSATTHSVLLLLTTAALTSSQLCYLLYSLLAEFLKCPLSHRVILALGVQTDLISFCFTGILNRIVKGNRNSVSIPFEFLPHTHSSLPFLLLSRSLRLYSTAHYLHIKSNSMIHKNQKAATFLLSVTKEFKTWKEFPSSQSVTPNSGITQFIKTGS